MHILFLLFRDILFARNLKQLSRPWKHFAPDYHAKRLPDPQFPFEQSFARDYFGGYSRPPT